MDEWTTLKPTTSAFDDEWSALKPGATKRKAPKKELSQSHKENLNVRKLNGKFHRDFDEWDLIVPVVDHNWRTTGLVMGMATQRCMCCGYTEDFSIGVFLRQQHTTGARRHERLAGQVPVEFTDLEREIDTLCFSDIPECPRCFALEPTAQLPLFDAEVPVVSTLMFKLAEVIIHAN